MCRVWFLLYEDISTSNEQSEIVSRLITYRDNFY